MGSLILLVYEFHRGNIMLKSLVNFTRYHNTTNHTGPCAPGETLVPSPNTVDGECMPIQGARIYALALH